MEIKRTRYISLFLISVVLSSFLLNLFIKINHFDGSGLLISNYIINDQDYSSVFPYVFGKRIKQFVLIFILMLAINADFVVGTIIVLFGLFFGIMITNQIYMLGISGIIVLIICFLPHYPVYFILIKNLYKFNDLKFDKRNIISFWIAAISIFVIGIIFECYFSKFFQNLFSQYIVM